MTLNPRTPPPDGLFQALLEQLPLDVQIHRLSDEGSLTCVYSRGALPAPSDEGARGDDLDAAASALAQVARTGEGRELGTLEVHRQDGRRALVRELLIPLPGGHVARVAQEVAAPTTDGGLERGGDRWQAIFQTSRTALCIGDEHGRLSVVNPAFEALYGYGPGQMDGMAISALFTEAEREEIAKIGARTQREGWHRFESTHVRRDGTTIPVLVELTSLGGIPEGQGQRFAAVHDISELVEARQAIQEQSEALRRANGQLQRSNVELQRFAYIASHDLQEPLRTVSSFCQLIQRDTRGQLDERSDRWFEFVVDGVARMQQLIVDLLAFSRLESRALKREPVELDRVVKQAMLLLKDAIAGREDKFVVGALPTLTGDTAMLLQLMQNLISNAVKFSPDGLDVHIDAERIDGAWRVAIRDQGIGIKETFLEDAFEIFKRLEPRRKYAGTGIGLAICRKVVERHGGRIWVESTRGEGSTFFFELPDATEDQRSGLALEGGADAALLGSLAEGDAGSKAQES